MKKLCFVFIAIFCIKLTVSAGSKILSTGPNLAHTVHNQSGERVGTARRDNLVFYLYDMNNRKVENPAKFMKQPEDDCYLFDRMGYAIGKCSATRIILWR